MFKKTAVLVGLMGVLTGCGGSSGSGKSVAIGLVEAPPPAVATLPYYYVPQFSGLGDNARIRVTGLPQWASLDPVTGAISGIPGEEDVTAGVELSLTATDGALQGEATVALKVEHGAAYRQREALDFYAVDGEGKPRALRNDLSGGTLQGEVQFVQSHSVRPRHNFVQNTQDETQSVYSPKLTALREALLLFIPQGVEPVTVDVEVSVQGEVVGTYAMKHPKELPASDHRGEPRVEYSTRAWSLVLPWDRVRNGLSLRFIANAGSKTEQEGALLASEIDIGEASQIVFQSLRLGMLTHVDATSGHYTLNDPVMAATDYFQTLPVSKLVMASYADMELDRVIVANGKIYDEVSDGEGGIYGGDMRENVAKSQVSVGINMANFGYPSHHMQQAHPHVFKQITNHHAWGNYQNGRQAHGLSGGNGIGTLVDSRGNEASHEWGHAYGLGHYPGATLTEDGRWQRHHADSGWGYIAHRNRLRANITHQAAAPLQPHGTHFAGLYPYHWDAMSGGATASEFSAYTHYTSFTARIIQNDLARFPIPDADYASGYKIWNTVTGAYEEYTHSHPAPKAVGVPVATILGGYDPDGTNAVIYPVFHGNYGNLFELPEPDLASGANACWVAVSNDQGEERKVAVAPQRHHSATVNQIHFNLAAEFRPTQAVLSCRRNGETIELTRTTFDGLIPELPPVAVVGQEQGFDQLRQREMTEIEQRLLAIADQALAVVDHDLRIKLDSYTDSELEEGLSGAAVAVLHRVWSAQRQVLAAEALLGRLKVEKVAGAKARASLMELLMAQGLIGSEDDLAVTGEILHYGNNQLSTALAEEKYISIVRGGADEAPPAQWVMSARGSLHPLDQPWNCLVPMGSRLGLATCDAGQANQQWNHGENQTLQNQQTKQCLDYDWVGPKAIMYGCHGGANQRWAGVQRTDNPLFALLPGEALKLLYLPVE